jgi:hypothetical protein
MMLLADLRLAGLGCADEGPAGRSAGHNVAGPPGSQMVGALDDQVYGFVAKDQTRLRDREAMHRERR